MNTLDSRMKRWAQGWTLTAVLLMALMGAGCSDAGTGGTDGGDGGCLQESDSVFCAGHGKNCDEFSAEDNCGTARTVDCGSCPELQTCGVGIPNVCGVLAVTDPVCGDERIEGDEDCDGADLDEQSCIGLGYDEGELVCDPVSCAFDRSDCRNISGGEEVVLYDGESVPFASASTWDGNGSTLVDSGASPYSGTNHLRASLNVSGWWGGVAYLPAPALNSSFATADELRFLAKADQSMSLQVGLADDQGGQSESWATLDLGTTYEEYVVPLDAVSSGVVLQSVYGVLFVVSEDGSPSYTVDVDDLMLRQGDPDTPRELVPADHPDILMVGRWDLSDFANPRSGWNSSYMLTSFSGPSIGIRMTDGNNNWTYSIDGGEHQTLVTTGATSYLLGENLSQGSHSLFIARRTEPYFGDVTFYGFEVAQGYGLSSPPSLPSRKIEFIGDSITAGYGNEGSSQSRSTQNGYMAYGPQTARLLDAQWHVAAISGIGMYRSLGDNNEFPTDLVITDHYDNLLPYDDSVQWDPSHWVPDVVVLALGTNDFAYANLDQAAFQAAGVAFLGILRDRYPDAHIFYMSHLHSSSSDARQAIEELVTQFADPKVYHLDPIGDVSGADNLTERPWLDIGSSDGIGDWTHPSLAGHTKIAQKLALEIQAKLAW